MNDPHVVALIYSIEHGDGIDYSRAAPFDNEQDEFRIRVENQQVRLELKDHYATEAAARQAVDRYIRRWEFTAGLSGRPGQFVLTFVYAEIEDRDPPPPTPGVVSLSATFRAGVPSMRASLTVSPPNYPPPPSGVTLDPDDPDVSTMYDRLDGYYQRKEPLSAMAYFCLTVLERGLEGNSRKSAAAKYGIELAVLKRIGELCAKKGGPQAARKAMGASSDLTMEEARFLEKAVKAIIRRRAECAGGDDTQRPRITLRDLCGPTR